MQDSENGKSRNEDRTPSIGQGESSAPATATASLSFLGWLRTKGTVSVLVTSLVIASCAGSFIHELGHGLTAIALGGKVYKVWVFCIQVYPQLRFEGWDPAFLGRCPSDVKGEWQQGLTSLMGSGATLLVAYGLVGIAFLLTRHRRLIASFSLIAFIFAWDILLYSTLPLLGLRHGFILGGPTPEPLDGALRIGMPESLYFILLLLHFLIFHALLVLLWRRTLRLPRAGNVRMQTA